MKNLSLICQEYTVVRKNTTHYQICSRKHVESDLAKGLAKGYLEKLKKYDKFHCVKIFSLRVVFVNKDLRYQDFIIVSKYPKAWFDYSEINFRNDVNDPRFSYTDSCICNFFNLPVVTKKTKKNKKKKMNEVLISVYLKCQQKSA